MSEDLLVKHCSPTLAGLKTGNLFNCSCSSEKEAVNFVNTYNKILSKKGIKLILLNYSNNRALLYLYRKNKLKSDLSTPYAEFLLRMQGYNSIDVESCIAQLKRRVKLLVNFPTKSDFSSVIPLRMFTVLFATRVHVQSVQVVGKFMAMRKKRWKNLQNLRNALVFIT